MVAFSSNGNGHGVVHCLKKRQRPCHGPRGVASLQLGTVLLVLKGAEDRQGAPLGLPSGHFLGQAESSLTMRCNAEEDVKSSNVTPP